MQSLHWKPQARTYEYNRRKKWTPSTNLKLNKVRCPIDGAVCRVQCAKHANSMKNHQAARNNFTFLYGHNEIAKHCISWIFGTDWMRMMVPTTMNAYNFNNQKLTYWKLQAYQLDNREWNAFQRSHYYGCVYEWKTYRIYAISESFTGNIINICLKRFRAACMLPIEII